MADVGTEVAVRGEVLPAALSELADIANREHGMAEGAARTALEHAIRSGEALLAAREQVLAGEWTQWIQTNFRGSYRRAYIYMRTAWLQDHLSMDMTIEQAQAGLKGMQGPVRKGSVHARKIDPHMRAEILALRDEGISDGAIADAVGVSRPLLATVLDPAKAERWRANKLARDRQRAAAKNEAALAERARRLERAAKRRTGTALADSYSNLRKLAQSLDAAHTDAKSTTHKAYLSKALAALYRIEDDIGYCLGADE